MTEESKMINRIFDEIRDADDAVTLPRVAAFFEQCPLYYQIYNFSAGKLI